MFGVTDFSKTANQVIFQPSQGSGADVTPRAARRRARAQLAGQVKMTVPPLTGLKFAFLPQGRGEGWGKQMQATSFSICFHELDACQHLKKHHILFFFPFLGGWVNSRYVSVLRVSLLIWVSSMLKPHDDGNHRF